MCSVNVTFTSFAKASPEPPGHLCEQSVLLTPPRATSHPVTWTAEQLANGVPAFPVERVLHDTTLSLGSSVHQPLPSVIMVSCCSWDKEHFYTAFKVLRTVQTLGAVCPNSHSPSVISPNVPMSVPPPHCLAHSVHCMCTWLVLLCRTHTCSPCRIL